MKRNETKWNRNETYKRQENNAPNVLSDNISEGICDIFFVCFFCLIYFSLKIILNQNYDTPFVGSFSEEEIGEKATITNDEWRWALRPQGQGHVPTLWTIYLLLYCSLTNYLLKKKLTYLTQFSTECLKINISLSDFSPIFHRCLTINNLLSL